MFFKDSLFLQSLRNLYKKSTTIIMFYKRCSHGGVIKLDSPRITCLTSVSILPHFPAQ